MIGELLVGMLIGPFALGWVGVPTAGMIQSLHDEGLAVEVLHAAFEVLAELGVIVLLFMVGLETRLSDILRVGVRAGLVAVAGVIVPFVLGFVLVASLGHPTIEAIFIGTAMVATSVGITARVLADLGHIRSTEAPDHPGRRRHRRHPRDDRAGGRLGAGRGRPAFLDPHRVDRGPGDPVYRVRGAGRSPRRQPLEHPPGAPQDRNAPFVVAVGAMLGLATAAAQIGLAAIIGAFLAGMVFAELSEQYELEKQTLPLYEFLVPLFFVITGSRVDWRLFLDGSVLGLALTVTALAIVGKLIGCGAAALGMGGWRPVAIIGVGMAPRGEVGLIVANVGASMAIIPNEMFSTVVIMSVLTTLVVPRARVLYPPSDEEQPAGAIDYAVADGRLPGPVGSRVTHRKHATVRRNPRRCAACPGRLFRTEGEYLPQTSSSTRRAGPATSAPPRLRETFD